ncbi:hypothetical protein ABIE45_004056 [Methylobacterium sp. OAE515]
MGRHPAALSHGIKNRQAAGFIPGPSPANAPVKSLGLVQAVLGGARDRLRLPGHRHRGAVSLLRLGGGARLRPAVLAEVLPAGAGPRRPFLGRRRRAAALIGP